MSRRGAGQVRLIGGRHRGRRLDVIDVPGLRPSPDRLRETLFNWLAPWLPGARCLDLFAGSGALGFEAASRGAASVTLVERDARAVAALRAAAQTLAFGDGVAVVQGDALAVVAGLDEAVDIVFIDPPFEQGGQAEVLERLLGGALAPAARVHVESAARDDMPLPAGYEVLKDRRFGDARARLLRPGD